MIWTDELEARAREHAEESYPAECCGLLLQSRETGVGEYRPCDNLQDVEPVLDPSGRVRGADTAFRLDGTEVVRAEREGFDLRGIVHSHPDHPAQFSAMDREQATWRFEDDAPEPAFPGVSYLVISVYDGCSKDAVWFQWQEGERDFVEGLAP